VTTEERRKQRQAALRRSAYGRGRATRARYSRINRERLRAAAAEYRKANRAKIQARDRRYYEANRRRIIEQNKRYRQRNREKMQVRRRHRLGRAGTPITLPEWRDLKREVKRCWFCGKPFTKTNPAVVDHDHDNGYVRVPLHSFCNKTEGALRKIGIVTSSQLQAFAVRLAAIRMMPWLSMAPAEIKAAKRRAKGRVA
jgi:hypothetical protein